MNNNHPTRDPNVRPPQPPPATGQGPLQPPPPLNLPLPQVPGSNPENYMMALGYVMGTPMYPSGSTSYVHPQLDQPPWPQAYSRGTDPRYFHQAQVQSSPMAPQEQPFHQPQPRPTSGLPAYAAREAVRETVPREAALREAALRETNQLESAHDERLAGARTAANHPRKRALTACDACRIKKVKCDNVRPKCGSCVKNKIADCHYKSDDPYRDYSHLDAASLGIMMKLDALIRDVKEIKGEKTPKSVSPATPSVRPAIWDMSISSILQWKYFQQCSGMSADTVALKIARINSRLLRPLPDPIGKKWRQVSSPQFHRDIESLIAANVVSLYNSFFLNCHTKIPILDIQQILGMFEIFILVKRADPSLTLPKILDDFNQGDGPSSIYASSLKTCGARDLPYRRDAYKRLCDSTPFFLMVVSLGLLSTEIQLNNITEFANSIAERDSLSFSCLASNPNIPEGLPASRMELARLLAEYARYISILYPATAEEHSPTKILYHLLLSQFELLALRPLAAYKEVVISCQQMVYYLEEAKYKPLDEAAQERTNLLFWGCLKLENELRTELSPSVPSSGINDIVPPIAFPKVPRSAILQDDNESDVPGELKALSYNYVDRQSWYFFLTEIAFRKVDNVMYEDFFLQDHVTAQTWDTVEFSSYSVWHNVVKYLNQYNGIINSLNPKVRDFVLQEVNNEQIYKNIKKKWTKLKSPTSKEPDVLDQLDEFLMDDDLLIKMQSESIIYIKSRIVSSKLLLFRPLVYLILEDKIEPAMLFEAVLSVLQTQMSRQNAEQYLSNDEASSSHDSSGGFSNWDDVELNYQNLMQAPNVYQRLYPDEDFSLLIEYDVPSKADPLKFRLTSVDEARAKVLRAFVQHLISIPKLFMPKMLSHRHPGSWYVIRNTVIGNIYMFLLYLKITGWLMESAGNPLLQQLLSGQADVLSPEDMAKMMDSVILKQSVMSNLEHTSFVLEYLKDECPDCEVYLEIIKGLMKKLQA